MPPRPWIIGLLGLACALLARPGWAAGWLETSVKTHSARLEVESDGSAVIRQELVLGVRGGPLRSLEIPGVDTDAELLPEATATPIVRYGVPAAIPLTVARQEDGTLRIEVEREKGLFTGSYAFRFSYRTQLLSRDRIRRRSSLAEVEWIGPRLPDGVDAAKVVFRLPAASLAPTLPSGADQDDTAALGTVYLSGMRHAGEYVEVELVRPHLSRGEPAVWRLLTDPKAFPGLREPLPQAKASPIQRVVFGENPQKRAGFALLAGVLALAYAGLLVLKQRLAERDAALRGASVQPLVPLPLGLRAALAGALLASAGVMAMLGELPTLSGVTLCVATWVASLRTPRPIARPRGPGCWLALVDTEAFNRRPTPLSGRFLDFGAWPGCLFALLLLGGISAGVVSLAPAMPYHALALALSALALVPIFGLARATAFPAERGHDSGRLLQKAKKELQKRDCKVAVWARIPDGASEPDELRLLLRPSAPVEGLIAVEVGVDWQSSPAGHWADPYVLVRVQQESRAQRLLSPPEGFQRGRRSDERVGIWRPRLPELSELTRLSLELVSQLSQSNARSQASARAAHGSRLRVASPAQA